MGPGIAVGFAGLFGSGLRVVRTGGALILTPAPGIAGSGRGHGRQQHSAKKK
jgi:hypothetical protein